MTALQERLPMATAARGMPFRAFATRPGPRARAAGSIFFEWALLGLWALSITWPLIEFGPNVVPRNTEYFRSSYNHFIWERFRECGSCVFWNGNFSGGFPAFADPLNAMLHPLVVVNSIAFGARDGTIIALISLFFLAGIAQWWFAWELGLGSAGRLWSAGVAVAGGRLAAQVDQGLFGSVASSVSAIFVLSALIRLRRDPNRRSAALLGVTGGLFILSGQGYLQVAMVLMAPLLLILFSDALWPIRLLARRLALAMCIGLLLGAPLIVPFLHFYPAFAKDLDPALNLSQPFGYIPLNLVINDADFYRTGSLGAPIYPYLSVNYVGWIAVLSALSGVAVLLVEGRRRLCAFFVIWSIGAMWFASAAPLRWVRDNAQSIEPIWEFVVGIRSPTLVAGLATPIVLALSGVGIDHVWKLAAPDRIKFSVNVGDTDRVRSVPFDLRWLLVIVLMWAMLDARAFARRWLAVVQQPADLTEVLDALATPGAEWVNPPFGEDYWAGTALERNLKLAKYVKPWRWDGRADPQPVLEAFRGEAPGVMSLATTTPTGIRIFAAPPGNEYAAVVDPDGTRTPCLASSSGGNITVRCNTTQPGQLQVRENHYSGWSARVNGHDSSVSAIGQWMGVDVPAGTVEVKLRYRPWDVMVGLVLFAVGLAVAAYCLVRSEPRADLPLTEPDAVATDASATA